MNRIDRITKMEKNLDASAEAIAELSAALDKYEAARKAWKELSDYYGSNRWMSDFEADEAGKLPKDLKRGVLSEDTVYDLITDNRELVSKMLEIARDAVLNNLI